MAYNDLTNMLTVNPWLFDPSQQSNQFSNYNNAPLPGPSYNPGLAGGPVNAATGQPIASFQQWLQQNPGGMNINATPSAPAPQTQNNGAFSPAQAGRLLTGTGQWGLSNPGGFGGQNNQVALDRMAQLTAGYQPQQQAAAGATGAAAGAAGAGGAPNNWQAALNALANPGNPVTPGATVPQATGSQPAGGVNAAWLQGIGSGQGMNQNFVNALRNIQGR